MKKLLQTLALVTLELLLFSSIGTNNLNIEAALRASMYVVLFLPLPILGRFVTVLTLVEFVNPSDSLKEKILWYCGLGSLVILSSAFIFQSWPEKSWLDLSIWVLFVVYCLAEIVLVWGFTRVIHKTTTRLKETP